MKYFYKNGDIVKDGDIAFYTEFNGKDWEYNYANGLCEIFKHEGKLWSRCILFTQDYGKTFTTISDAPVELKHCTRLSKETELMHHYKIEEKYRLDSSLFHKHFSTDDEKKFIKIFNSINK